jgi:hypothetical protein
MLLTSPGAVVVTAVTLVEQAAALPRPHCLLLLLLLLTVARRQRLAGPGETGCCPRSFCSGVKKAWMSQGRVMVVWRISSWSLATWTASKQQQQQLHRCRQLHWQVPQLAGG